MAAVDCNVPGTERFVLSDASLALAAASNDMSPEAVRNRRRLCNYVLQHAVNTALAIDSLRGNEKEIAVALSRDQEATHG